jgi:hypothetical protein
MANANGRLTLADFVGNHQDHKLVHDTPSNVRYSDQPVVSGDTASKRTNHTGGRGDDQSGSEEAANEDDEEDSSAGQEADPDDEEDDPEVFAPSHVSGKGKGKRPAIRIEPAGDASQSEDAQSASHEAGHHASIDTIQGMLNGNKKRTYSNVSNTSLLFGDDEAGISTFPRPKLARTLAHSGGSGLLTYKVSKDGDMNGFDNAIESSDEEASGGEEQGINFDDEDYSGVNMISEDESDVEKLEEQEETFIIQDEHATNLFSQEFDDARRLSLDSHGSDNIFDFAPTGSYFPPISSYQDVGFGQFFETAPVVPTPEPLSKRKFSDNSMKRVRFDDEVQVSHSSSSSSSELDSATFPDLFLEQDKLPPSLYQLMEVDQDSDDASFASSASEHSYWDVGQDETRNLTQIDPSSGVFDDDDDESSGPGSSGYESMIDLAYNDAMYANATIQPTWVILQTNMIPMTLALKLKYALLARSLFCIALRPHRGRRFRARDPFRDQPSALPGVSSSMKTVVRQLLSQTVTLGPSLSIAPVHPYRSDSHFMARTVAALALRTTVHVPRPSRSISQTANQAWMRSPFHLPP